jgi:hypothetical protein
MDQIKTVSLIETPFDLKDREVMCYPYFITAIQVAMPRPFLKPRLAYTVVTTDLVKGIPARANMFPETTEIEIDSTALVPSLLSREEATKKARKLALKWAMYKFHLFRTPKIDIVKVEEAYKAFFFAEINKERILVDSVKGLEDVKLTKK